MGTHRLDTISLSHKVEKIRQILSSRVVNQDKAINSLLGILDKYFAGMCDTTRPVGNLLFLGPTGSGKTYLCECLAESLFGSPNSIIKIDCAEFQHSHEIAKLIGSPPGYLGHRETHAILTQESINKYHTETTSLTIVLFDEIEKANDALWSLLLGILDKGTLTLGDNRRVDMTKCLIIMTSNAGSQEQAKIFSHLGFVPETEEIDPEKIEKVAVESAKRKFTPEFINRLDDIVTFNTLSKGDIEKILGLEIDKVQVRVMVGTGQMFFIEPSPAAVRQLLVEGFDKKYNARHMKRAVDRLVTKPLARARANGSLDGIRRVVVDYKKDKWDYYGEVFSDDVLQP